MKKLFLVDSHALLHRFYHALPPLNSPDGKAVQAIFGLSGVLLKLSKDFKPNYLGAAADTPAQTFRSEKFADYKANRAPTADDLKSQLSMAPETFAAFGIPLLRVPGYEADDVIGTMARAFESKDLEIQIFSGDLDLLQLVRGESVIVTILKSGLSNVETYTEQKVIERYGIPPSKIPEWKGLVGDPSDNIPGAKGIGPKTARELLVEFGTLEEIYDSLAIITPTTAKKLEDSKEAAFASRELATIKTDVPMEIPNLEDLAAHNGNRESLIAYFDKFGFSSLKNRLGA